MREEFFGARLRCGLEAYVLPKRGFRQRVALFSARYGSIDLAFRTTGSEDVLETPPGIAHFLEHQLFKKEGGQDLLMEFGRYGASSNAFTDYTSTTYYFSASESFEPNLALLLRLTFSPYFRAKHVAKEKQIIEQELRMYEDMPDYRGYRALLGSLYRRHPVRIDVGGSIESVRLIDAALLERCYGVFYHPANLMFVASGDLDPGEVFRSLDRDLPPDRFARERVVSRVIPGEPPGVAEPRVECRMTASRPRVLVGLKDLSDGDVLGRDLTSTALLTLLFGRSGGFYSKAYESGLIDDSFSFSYTAECGFGFAVLGGETDRPDELAEAVCGVLDRARRKPFKKRDVERTKRRMQGKYLRAFDSPEDAVFLLLGCRMKGIEPFSVPGAIQRITPERLGRRLRELFRKENLAVSVVLPK